MIITLIYAYVYNLNLYYLVFGKVYQMTQDQVGLIQKPKIETTKNMAMDHLDLGLALELLYLQSLVSIYTLHSMGIIHYERKIREVGSNKFELK